ncbi:MAG: HAMP domain-containing histidine kinase [Clostridia bacterium]|nr:HAMP domain-containing histidine kinase [Clostridia bacterium]
MIGKSKKEFLIISMSFLLITFALLFLIFYLTTSNSRNEMILRELSFTEETYLNSNQIIKQNSFVVEIIDGNTHDYLKVFDSNKFTENTIDNVIEIATHRNYGYGSVDNIYYKISSGEKRLIVAIDSTDLNLLFKANLSTALIILASAYGAVFIIILLTSSKFVKPINDTLNRQLQFISNASHELKTPIAVISANAQVLKNIDDNKWVENIQTQTERMRVLVSDMLTLAKIDENTTKLVKEKFNLSETVVACSLPFDALAFENGCFITLNVDSGIEYDGDVESIKIILNVLLDNAVNTPLVAVK